MIAQEASLSDFLGEGFPYWKVMMEMYIKSMHYQLWQIITKGDIKISSSKED